MSRRTSVTDRVGGHVVSFSEGDLYSSRSTLLTAVERTVEVLTDVRNLAAPGWSRSLILSRSLGLRNVLPFGAESGSVPEPDSTVPLDWSGSGTGEGVDAAGAPFLGAERVAEGSAVGLACSRRVMALPGQIKY